MAYLTQGLYSKGPQRSNRIEFKPTGPFERPYIYQVDERTTK